MSDIDSAGNVEFALTFDREPDLFAIDDHDLAANEFQFFIADTDELTNFFSGRIERYDAIVQGVSIHTSGDITVRDNGPDDGSDLTTHGWGALTARIPYRLDGRHLTFSVPAAALGVERRFGYLVIWLHYGRDDRSSSFFGFSGEKALPAMAP